MATCQICKREFTRLKFATDHIKICTRCVNTLNEFKEPAIHAQKRLSELLAIGMERNARRDLASLDIWKRNKARRTLDNFEVAFSKALPGWLNRLLADTDNTTRDYKIMRSHRRGLLRIDGEHPWSYPSNWVALAAGVRARDKYSCTACQATNVVLDVHHIIYLSNYGTNQQNNLVTLCRPCHELEHDRVFDFGETDDPESHDPIQPKPARAPYMEPAATPECLPPPSQVHEATPADRILTKDIDSLPCPKCGELCMFRLSVGDALRCGACGSMHSLYTFSESNAAFASEESLSEGGYVLEEMNRSSPGHGDKKP